MKCIKTGFTILIKDVNKISRMDLFIDGSDLYTNQNDLFDYDQKYKVDLVCDSLEMNSKYNKIINPVISQELYDYVDYYENQLGGIAEQTFLLIYKDKIGDF